MKKYIKELTQGELVQVIESNAILCNELIEHLQEVEMFFIGDIIDALTLNDWSIGFCGRNFIKADTDPDGNLYDFLSSIKDVQEDYCFLSQEDGEKAGMLQGLLDVYEDMEDENTKKDLLYDYLASKALELEAALLAQFNKCTQYDFTTADLIEELTACGVYDDCYIIDDNYTLFEDVRKMYA